MHACLDCEFKNFGFPCRKDGKLDVEALASHYVEEVCDGLDDEESANEPNHWSFDCVWELTQGDPEMAWEFILASIGKLKNASQVSVFAAGPLESLIYRHGPAVIDRIEELARRSPRFAFVLSGVWPQGQQDTPVWKRIEALKASGPQLDNGDALPAF